MKNINIIVTLLSILLLILFAVLKTIWIGFVYFAIVTLIGICLYWIVIISINYIYEYRTNLLSGFKFFCAKIINSSNVTTQMIEDDKENYIKKYKKSLVKEKVIEWVKILFLLSIIIVSIVAIVTGMI